MSHNAATNESDFNAVYACYCADCLLTCSSVPSAWSKEKQWSIVSSWFYCSFRVQPDLLRINPGLQINSRQDGWRLAHSLNSFCDLLYVMSAAWGKIQNRISCSDWQQVTLLTWNLYLFSLKAQSEWHEQHSGLHLSREKGAILLCCTIEGSRCHDQQISSHIKRLRLIRMSFVSGVIRKCMFTSDNDEVRWTKERIFQFKYFSECLWRKLFTMCMLNRQHIDEQVLVCCV